MQILLFYFKEHSPNKNLEFSLVKYFFKAPKMSNICLNHGERKNICLVSFRILLLIKQTKEHIFYLKFLMVAPILKMLTH